MRYENVKLKNIYLWKTQNKLLRSREAHPNELCASKEIVLKGQEILLNRGALHRSRCSFTIVLFYLYMLCTLKAIVE